MIKRMRKVDFNELSYYQFDIFPPGEIFQAIFTRQGGVSPSPWKSLNQGGTTGDSRPRVVENRRLAFESLGLDVSTIFDVWQVHGTKIIDSGRSRNLDQPHEKADGIVTARKGITLFMRFADCVPILLFDPVVRVIAIVHAGWKGTVNHIGSIAVRHLEEKYGCNPANILAGIGPSIGPDHYYIKNDVMNRVKASFPLNWQGLLQTSDRGTLLNLWEANKLSLENSGVEQIEIAGQCTACNLEDWYSHRAEDGKTGRFGVLLALR
jgi:polyphenol oxidase